MKTFKNGKNHGKKNRGGPWTPLHVLYTSFKYAFFIQIGLIIVLSFLPFFEAIQHILTSRARWKIPKRVDVLQVNTVNEFSRKQE